MSQVRYTRTLSRWLSLYTTVKSKEEFDSLDEEVKQYLRKLYQRDKDDAWGTPTHIWQVSKDKILRGPMGPLHERKEDYQRAFLNPYFQWREYLNGWLEIGDSHESD